MPPISQGDRRILTIAGLAFLLLIVLGFLFSPANTGDNSSGTTYSASSNGAKAAFLLLQELGYHAERWEQPTSALKGDEHTVLIIAAPVVLPNETEKNAIEHFLSQGGKVIATGIAGARFLPDDNSEYDETPKEPWSEFPALAPSAVTRVAPKITIAPVARWSGDDSVALYGKPGKVVVTHFPYGKGDVLWLASLTPFSNAGITQTGNLEFALAALGNKEQTRVLFDEYVHGYGADKVSSRKHPLMMALFLQCLVLGCAALLSFSRRSGPVRPLRVETRLAPLEFVETLGGLYQQARAAAVAVDVYYNRFQYWTTRRLGLSPNAAPEELARAIRERWHVEDEGLLPTLEAAASARYRPDLPPSEALTIVQSLYGYAVNLKLFSPSKENP